MFVLTVDQIGSRHSIDRVGDALSALAGLEAAAPFARTVGDEFQGALPDPASVVEAVVTLLRPGHWHVGLGVGPVEVPLPVDPRAGRGPAFLAARSAVERAKREPSHLSVVSADEGTEATDASAALQLLAALYQRRSPEGWEAVEELRRSGSQAGAAARLGISRQAVGQRLRAAGWSLEQQARPMVARLLARADAAASGSGAASGPSTGPAYAGGMDAPSLGTLDWQPARTRPELLAVPVNQALELLDVPCFAAAIDADLADTAAFCDAYQVPLEVSANCVVVAGRRGETTTTAACLVLATDRADVNRVVRRHLDVRKISFASTEDAVSQTQMEYGGITPVGLPSGWPLLVDQAVVGSDWVVVGSGLRGSKLALRGADCARLPGAEVLDLRQPRS